MKKTFSILFTLLLSTPLFFASAHGGVEKRSGPIVVHYTQDPLSPLVGETVRMYFLIRDETIDSKDSSKKNLVNWPVRLTVIKTSVNEPDKDMVLEEKNFITDINGSFSYQYVFTEKNYFDIDLDFKDQAGRDQEAGFLISVRKGYDTTLPILGTLFLIVTSVVFSRLDKHPSSIKLIF